MERLQLEVMRDMEATLKKVIAHAKRLEAENKRLREAVQIALSYAGPGDDWVSQARAALQLSENPDISVANNPSTDCDCSEKTGHVCGQKWQPIVTAPKDGTPVIFANFDSQCLLCGAPHVWSGRYADMGDGVEMLEASFAAINENGEPTHWMPQPPEPSND